MEQQTDQQIDLTQLVSLLQVKLDAANAQILHLGLLVEFLYKELEDKNIGLALDTYPEWAQDRFKEIQNLGDSEEGKQIQTDMKKEMEEIAKNIKL